RRAVLAAEAAGAAALSARLTPRPGIIRRKSLLDLGAHRADRFGGRQLGGERTGQWKNLEAKGGTTPHFCVSYRTRFTGTFRRAIGLSGSQQHLVNHRLSDADKRTRSCASPSSMRAAAAAGVERG